MGWLSDWRWSQGQYRATYVGAGLFVYYDADDRVLRVRQGWDELPAPGTISPGSDDW